VCSLARRLHKKYVAVATRRAGDAGVEWELYTKRMLLLLHGAPVMQGWNGSSRIES